MLLFGGYDGESNLNNDVWLFDARTAAWTMLLPHTAQAADASVRPDGRFGHSAITRNSSLEVVIFGGYVDEGISSDVLSFSMCTRQWTRHECAGASPSPRVSTRPAAWRREYTFSGVARRREASSTTCWSTPWTRACGRR